MLWEEQEKEILFLYCYISLILTPPPTKMGLVVSCLLLLWSICPLILLRLLALLETTGGKCNLWIPAKRSPGWLSVTLGPVWLFIWLVTSVTTSGRKILDFLRITVLPSPAVTVHNHFEIFTLAPLSGNSSQWFEILVTSKLILFEGFKKWANCSCNTSRHWIWLPL